jgi:hypothetical protein
MPFSLMLREGSWSVLASRYPELLNAPIINRFDEKVRFLAPPPVASGTSAVPSAIIFPKFSPSGERRMEGIDSFQTLLKLQESGFWVPHDPDSIRAFLRWVQSIPAYIFSYSNLTEAVTEIRGFMSARSESRLQRQ